MPALPHRNSHRPAQPCLPNRSKPDHVLPLRATPAVPIPTVPHLSRTCLSMPALPYHAMPSRAMPAYPILSLPSHASPCLPYRAPPNPSTTGHACQTAPLRSLPVQNTPRLPCHTPPHLALLRPACQTMPICAMPVQSMPRLLCQTSPHLSGAVLATPYLPYQTGTRQTPPIRAYPSLPWFKRYSIPNLVLIAFSRSLSTTWNKPNPHPALALLSGLPAPIPTCKPQRLIKLITSTVLN